MAHVIIRDRKGRRHETNFGEDRVRIEIHSSDTTLEILVEGSPEDPEHRRPFVLLNVPRHKFSEAMGRAARRPKRE